MCLKSLKMWEVPGDSLFKVWLKFSVFFRVGGVDRLQCLVRPLEGALVSQIGPQTRWFSHHDGGENKSSSIRVKTKRFTSRHHCSCSDTHRLPLQWNMSGGDGHESQNLGCLINCDRRESLRPAGVSLIFGNDCSKYLKKIMSQFILYFIYVVWIWQIVWLLIGVFDCGQRNLQLQTCGNQPFATVVRF